MSKSLKNFTTIQNFLEHNSADTFRMFVLQHSYRSSLHLSNDRIKEAEAIIKRFQRYFVNCFINILCLHYWRDNVYDTNLPIVMYSFFNAVEARNRQINIEISQSAPVTIWEDLELHLNAAMNKHRAAIHLSLANDFNTAKAIAELLELVSATQVYMAQRGGNARRGSIWSSYTFIRDILTVFGLNLTNDANTHVDNTDVNNQSADAVIEEFLKYRSQVRKVCLSSDNNEIKSGVLKLCDEFRDAIMPRLGVSVEDHAGGTYIWKRTSKT